MKSQSKKKAAINYYVEISVALYLALKQWWNLTNKEKSHLKKKILTNLNSKKISPPLKYTKNGIISYPKSKNRKIAKKIN